MLLQEGERVLQKNEGEWQYTLEESSDGCCIELEVDVGPYLDTSLIKADVQPLYARLLIKVCRLISLLQLLCASNDAKVCATNWSLRGAI